MEDFLKGPEYEVKSVSVRVTIEMAQYISSEREYLIDPMLRAKYVANKVFPAVAHATVPDHARLIVDWNKDTEDYTLTAKWFQEKRLI